MLTRIARKAVVDDLKEIDFTFDSWTPTVSVQRHNEDFDKKLPFITTEFMPSNRKKFQSISNVIGDATPLGMYHEYGYCQIEAITVRIYCAKYHNNRNINGRDLIEDMHIKILRRIYKRWDYLLEHYYASIDIVDSGPSLREITIYEGKSATKIYIYDITVYVRTQFRWNDIPDDYEDGDEEILEEIGKIRINEYNIGSIETN